MSSSKLTQSASNRPFDFTAKPVPVKPPPPRETVLVKAITPEARRLLIDRVVACPRAVVRVRYDDRPMGIRHAQPSDSIRPRTPGRETTCSVCFDGTGRRSPGASA